jgi:hypothetical protein
MLSKNGGIRDDGVHTLPELSRLCKLAANACIFYMTFFSRFQDIYAGCCNNGVPSTSLLRTSMNLKWVFWRSVMEELLANMGAMEANYTANRFKACLPNRVKSMAKF